MAGEEHGYADETYNVVDVKREHATGNPPPCPSEDVSQRRCLEAMEHMASMRRWLEMQPPAPKLEAPVLQAPGSGLMMKWLEREPRREPVVVPATAASHTCHQTVNAILHGSGVSFGPNGVFEEQLSPPGTPLMTLSPGPDAPENDWEDTKPKVRRAQFVYVDGRFMREVALHRQAARRRSLFTKRREAIIKKIRRWIATSIGSTVNGVEQTSPSLFFSLNPVTEDKKRRTDWLCHGLLGCDFPALANLLKIVADAPEHTRHGLVIDGHIVELLNIHESGGFKWASTFYKGTGQLVCENAVLVSDRVVDFPIICKQVRIDEDRAVYGRKVTEADLHPEGVQSDQILCPSDLLRLRCNLPCESVDHPGYMARLVDTRPVNYVFVRPPADEEPPRRQIWGMKNRVGKPGGVSKRPRRRKQPQSQSSARHLTAYRPRRPVAPPFHGGFKARCPVTGRNKRYRTMAEWFTDRIEVDGILPEDVEPLSQQGVKHKGMLFGCPDGSKFHMFKTPVAGTRAHDTQRKKLLASLLNTIRRYVVQSDGPILFACKTGGRLIIFHHGNLSNLLDVITVGYCSLLEHSGGIPRESLGAHVRTDPTQPRGPPVRSTCSFYLSTPQYQDLGRKHGVSRTEPVGPWGKTIYHRGKPNECCTVLDRRIPTIATLGPRYSAYPQIYDMRELSAIVGMA